MGVSLEYPIDVYTSLGHYTDMSKLVTIVETFSFKADASKHLTEEQRLSLATTIAENPRCGAVMPGTGGCRKVRFALDGSGKSGSVRAVYTYFGEEFPTFLLALFAKNEKSNLSNEEKKQIAKIVNQIKKNYKK